MKVVNRRIYHAGTVVLREDGEPLSINQAVMMQWPKFCNTWPADKSLIPGILSLVRERKMSQKTLEKTGTPWAECYRGSGRLTGRLAAEPVYQDNGDVAPGWTWVGDVTEAEFFDEFEEQQHDHCHIPDRVDWGCPHCVAAGWVKEEIEAVMVRGVSVPVRYGGD